MRRLLAIWIFGLALALPASAHGDGPIAGPLDGGAGASTPGGKVAYVTVATDGGRTLLERIQRDGGVVQDWAFLRGGYGVSAVGYDGVGTGLSANGRTLVLQTPVARYPVRWTRLAVVDAPRFRVRERIRLRGDFGVDAISPDGRWLYLLRYPSAQNLFRYDVRVYDLRGHRLLVRPVVDPREPDEKMAGQAMRRTTSADGRYVYTLYQRQSGAPFVHALDTVGRTAHCVDLPARFDGADLLLRLADGGRTLRVSGPRVAAAIDTRTFALVRPAAARPRRAAAGGDGPGWALLLIAAPALLAGIGLAAARRRAPRPAAAVD